MVNGRKLCACAFLGRAGVGSEDESAQSTVPRVVIERVGNMGVQTHVKTHGQKFVMRQMQSQFLQHSSRAAAMPYLVSHSATVAKVVQQSANGDALLVNAIGVVLQGNLIGLPRMVCQSTSVMMVTVATLRKKAVVFHVVDYLFNVLTASGTQCANNLFLNCHNPF